ncbi:MAG: 1-acyl-sn-glycerol-3-phosphate acyltransferase [Myxococcota bacterium]
MVEPDDVGSWRPSEESIAAVSLLLEPWRRMCAPRMVNAERIPAQGPLLFVGNHTLYGLLDAPLLMLEVHEHSGHYLRPLADHAHFTLPGWRDVVTTMGGVDGTRENCTALLEAGETVLVFPGGAREVAKRRGEKYKLVWGDRVGFARMALQHGCPVVPFASVGIDDAFDIRWDAEDLKRSALGKVLIELGLREDLMLPVTSGLGGLPIPRPVRIYFGFGEPLDPADFEEGSLDDRAWALREATKRAIEGQLEELFETRSNDPHRSLLVRLARAALDKAAGWS